ncbi:HAD family phosphatase [Mariniblastus sp.]|nr:HAD family phosphatase [Mariniblastus sp.]
MAIRYLFFDLGKVLLDFDHESGCRQIAAVSGCSADKVDSILFESGLENSFETGLVDAEEFHAKFCEASGGSPSLEELLNACSDIFSMNVSMMPVVGQLAAVNFPMGILSNTCSAHWDHVFKKHTFLRENFIDYVLSYESKSMKPDSKIYLDAINVANVQANEIFFIDDKQENVDGAIAAGMDAVLYTNASQAIIDLQSRGVRFNL